jgi:hypothetical protein
MENFTITRIPIYDRKGKQVGIDEIRTYINPPPEVPICDGFYRVVCNCGQIHENISADVYSKWPTSTLEKCSCS